MPQADRSIVQRLGKSLQLRLESDVQAPFPRRWVELIQYLDEQERNQQTGFTGETQRTSQPRARTNDR